MGIQFLKKRYIKEYYTIENQLHKKIHVTNKNSLFNWGLGEIVEKETIKFGSFIFYDHKHKEL